MKSQQKKRSGAVLIMLVLILVSILALGVSSITVSVGATMSRITVSYANRAYYLAESGVEYAKAARLVASSALPAGVYTVDGGDQIELTTVVVSNGVRVVSIGVVNPGARMEMRRKITFIVYNPGENEVVPVGFDFDNDGEFDDDTWNLDGLKKADIVETGPSGGEPALDLMGTVGSIQLNWQNKPELDLANAWNSNGQLLGYEVQMKVSPFDTGNEQAFSHHYMLGISFRLYPDISRSYGISFFRSRLLTANGKPESSPDWLPAELEPLRGTNVYLVLWYINDSQFDLINYTALDSSSGMVWINEGVSELKDYSTMLLKLDEKFAANGDRENHISAFLQNTAVYPNWDSADDIRWSGDAAVFPAAVQWDYPVTQNNIDSRLTSINFAIDRPSEIAVHVYYDLSGANKKFFDDFAMKVDGFETPTGDGDQIQY